MARGVRPPVPDTLTPDERVKLKTWVLEQARGDSSWGFLTHGATLRYVMDETLDYHRAIGNRNGYRDWVAVMRNSLRRIHAQPGILPDKMRPGSRPASTRYAQPGDAARETEAVVLRLFKGSG